MHKLCRMYDLRVYVLVEAPKERVVSMGICVGLCASRRSVPTNVPCAMARAEGRREGGGGGDGEVGRGRREGEVEKVDMIHET